MQLEWVAPAECPPQETVLARVRSLAGERATSRDLRVRARIVRVDARRWRLELTVGDESDMPRVVESDECSKLANATALIVSLDLQARERRDEESAPAPRPPQQPPPTSRSDPARRDAPSTPVPLPSPRPTARSASGHPRSALHWTLGARLIGDAGSLPTAALGVGFSSGLVYDAWRLQLGGTLWGRSVATADGQRGAGAGAMTSLRTADVRGCWRTLATPLELDSCVGMEAGGLRAVGFGVRRPSRSLGTWFAALLGLTARYRTSPRLGLNASLEIGIPILVPEAVIDGIGRIYAPAPVFGRAAIGIETVLF